jgi:hypothetical protein
MSATPLLETWFAAMDSDRPEDVLDMITDDFQMSVQFSKGAGESAEFFGDREGLVGYLDQREKSTLVHHLLTSASVDGTELGLGKTTRDGQFEASFNVSALIDPQTSKCRRLLICRTPAINVTD